MRSPPFTVGNCRRFVLFVFLVSVFTFTNAIDCPPGAMRGFPEDLTAPCYLFERFPTQFVTAERLCRIYGAQLVSIEDDFVNAFVAQGGVEAFEIMNVENFWIGGHDLHNKSVWNWADDHPWVFTKWDADEPNLGPNATHRCVSMQLDEGYWKASDCFDRKPYVCEFDPNEAENWTTTVRPTTTPLFLTTEHQETTPERHTSIHTTELSSMTPTSFIQTTTIGGEGTTAPPSTQTTPFIPLETTQPEKQTSPTDPSTLGSTTPPVVFGTSEEPTSTQEASLSSSSTSNAEATPTPVQSTPAEEETTPGLITLLPIDPSSASPSIPTEKPPSTSTVGAPITEQSTINGEFLSSSTSTPIQTTTFAEWTTDPGIRSTSTVGSERTTIETVVPSSLPTEETTGPVDETTVYFSTSVYSTTQVPTTLADEHTSSQQPTTTEIFVESTTINGEVQQTSTFNLPTTNEVEKETTRAEETTERLPPSTSQFVSTEFPTESTTNAETTVLSTTESTALPSTNQPVDTTTEEETTRPTTPTSTTTRPPTSSSTNTTTTTIPKIIYPCPRDWLYVEENDMCYFAMESHGWKADKLTCDLMGSSLVSIHSPLEGSKVKNLLFQAPSTPGQVDASIGLYEALEDGIRVWKWVDDSEMNWSNWAPGYPAENATGDLRCATFFTNTKSIKKKGQWKTVSCDSVQAQAACSKLADWSHFPRGAGAKGRRLTRAERRRVKQIPL